MRLLKNGFAAKLAQVSKITTVVSPFLCPPSGSICPFLAALVDLVVGHPDGSALFIRAAGSYIAPNPTS